MSKPQLNVPKDLSREHFLEAFRIFEEEGMPRGYKPSHTYSIAYQGKLYPTAKTDKTLPLGVDTPTAWRCSD